MNQTEIVEHRQCGSRVRVEVDAKLNFIAKAIPLQSDLECQTTMTHDELKQLKLRQAWDLLIEPDMDEITERTEAEYCHSLGIWQRLSGNPAICDITRQVMKKFRGKLISTPYKRGKQLRKRSKATVNRIMRDLHVIISPLWPADRVNPGGLGLTPIFKWPKALARQRQLPFVFSAGNLDQLYVNAAACRQTPGARTTPMNNPRLWRAAMVLALNCAARTWDLFDLRWSDVQLQSCDPYAFGSIVFNAQKTGKLHRIPLNQCAQCHLIDLSKLVLTRPSDRVFPGFSKGKAFYGTWKRICAAAGVVGTFESMRKTSVTRHNSIIWNVGNWLSGHIEPGVMGHYDNPSDRIFEAVYKLENPDEFVRGSEALVI